MKRFRASLDKPHLQTAKIRHVQFVLPDEGETGRLDAQDADRT